LLSLRSMMLAVPGRRAYVARCMRCGLSGSLREKDIDMKQTS
jgi:hypothetical protein